MAKMNRREFIRTGLAGMAGLTFVGKALANVNLLLPEEAATMDKVPLGGSGLSVSRVALGTGSVTRNGQSNQARLGAEKFMELARRAYERGICFFDTAATYGSQPLVGEVLKGLPREKITVLSKMWTYPDGSERVESVEGNLDRFRQELGTDYIDILLMHCMTQGDWNQTRKHYMEGFSRAKERGIVKAVGVSCHNLDALATAADSPWVDVIMARINPFGSNMDGSPDAVREILGRARRNGKGVVGMKIFGEGKNASEPEREESIRFALTRANVDCMTLGLESVAQVDDAVDRVMRLVHA